MAQTVKFGKLRAERDPDKGDAGGKYKGAGVHFGASVPYRVALASGKPVQIASIRGACAR